MNLLNHLVKPKHTVRLNDYDPRYEGNLGRKDAEKLFEDLTRELEELQELLYGANTHSLLVLLQGMDTAGKDGTIRKVFGSLNPVGCRVQPFKVPTSEELAHDFLWRIHHAVPGQGQIVIFNRSHYEDVLVVRVHNLVPEDVWNLRYRQINDFERLLVENNTIILKFFLHISKDEQRKRLLEREEDVTKAWKLAVADWDERTYWDDYQTAYEEALSRCSTDYAQWHIVAADRKWFRNVAVAQAVVNELRPYRQGWVEKLEQMNKKALDEVRALPAEKKQ